jgi:hypothetical protein
MELVFFILSLFFASLASHVENQRIKKNIEIPPLRGFEKLVNIVARYPTLIILILYQVFVLQIHMGLFLGIFLLCYGLCVACLKKKPLESMLLKHQVYLNTLSTLSVALIWFI